MIDASLPKMRADAAKLTRLLAASRELLAPLEEPFDIDMGLHRWLDGEREEAYSDWLAWVVQAARTPERVFRLFRLGTPPAALTGCSDLEVTRECCIPHGHADRTGRLDLVLSFGELAIVVVEVKTTDAEFSDTAKHVGYRRWLDSQKHSWKYPVFLAVSAEEEDYHGLRFLSWGNVALEVRRFAVELIGERKWTTASLVLAFAAAVEQNLLGFSAQTVRRICCGRATFFDARVVEFLKTFASVGDSDEPHQ